MIARQAREFATVADPARDCSGDLCSGGHSKRIIFPAWLQPHAPPAMPATRKCKCADEPEPYCASDKQKYQGEYYAKHRETMQRKSRDYKRAKALEKMLAHVSESELERAVQRERVRRGV